LIADRVWRTRPQLELAIVEYIGWFNHHRLHESLGDIPPAEYEQRWRALTAASTPNPDDQPVAPVAARAAEALTARRLLAVGAETGRNGADQRPLATSALAVDALSGPQSHARSVGPDHEGGTTLTQHELETQLKRSPPNPARLTEAPPFRALGHSKDHRPDLPQVVIGLAVTREGIPVRSRQTTTSNSGRSLRGAELRR
jgi:putative transposase